MFAKLNIKALTISAIVLVLVAAMIYLLPRPLAEPFSQARLDELNRDHQPVLVAIHADWCSTCKTQEKILQELLPQPEFSRIKMLRVDFDRQKDAVRSFGVQYQSTLIVFRNGHEVGRSTADQSPVRIAQLLHLGV